jgi:hypothetical protein
MVQPKESKELKQPNGIVIDNYNPYCFRDIIDAFRFPVVLINANDGISLEMAIREHNVLNKSSNGTFADEHIDPLNINFSEDTESLQKEEKIIFPVYDPKWFNVLEKLINGTLTEENLKSAKNFYENILK